MAYEDGTIDLEQLIHKTTKKAIDEASADQVARAHGFPNAAALYAAKVEVNKNNAALQTKQMNEILAKGGITAEQFNQYWRQNPQDFTKAAYKGMEKQVRRVAQKIKGTATAQGQSSQYTKPTPLSDSQVEQAKKAREALSAKNPRERIFFCSGKVFYDLRAGRRKRGITDIPLIRIAQHYPFAHDEFRAQIEKYREATEVVWVQEEPRNQGAWHLIQHYLRRYLLPHQTLLYAGRESSATPAVGYKSLHEKQQKALVATALTLGAGYWTRRTDARDTARPTESSCS